MSDRNRRTATGSDPEDDSYLFTEELSEPDPKDFTAKPFDLSTVDMDNLDELALQLLAYSYDYCHLFVPTQLAHLKSSISIANKRLVNARSADDYVKVSNASKVLIQSYSMLLEQATVIFMSSYRPLHTLIQTNQLRNSGTSVTETETETLEDEDEMAENDTRVDSDDSYQPYIDD